MNISYPVPIDVIPPAFQQLSHETVKAVTFFLVPAELLYFSIYFHTKGRNDWHQYLSILSLISLWNAPLIAPVSWYVTSIHTQYITIQPYSGCFETKISSLPLNGANSTPTVDQ